MTAQHVTALAYANEIRTGIAARRRELTALPTATAYRQLADWMADPDDLTARMKVGTALTSLPRVGRSKAARILSRLGLSSSALERRIAQKPGKSHGLDAHHLPLTRTARFALIDLLRSEADRIDKSSP